MSARFQSTTSAALVHAEHHPELPAPSSGERLDAVLRWNAPGPRLGPQLLALAATDEPLAADLIRWLKDWHVRLAINERVVWAALRGLNWRFRVYRYEVGMRFFPHVDVRTRLPDGETRASVVFYLNDEFAGGSTRFFETKHKGSRRGEGRGRKFDNRVRFELRPPVGGAVVFDHLMLHEGSEVTGGVKYAVRSDLIYAAR